MVKDGALILILCGLIIFPLSYNLGALLIVSIIPSSGRIEILPPYVAPFSIRIADMMADVVNPNFDLQSEATNWANTLTDLKTAAPNGEITHIQLRIWWSLLIDEFGNTGDNLINPKLGSNDGNGNVWGTQWAIMRRNLVAINQIPADPDNPIWKRWYFGQGVPLAYGPCAAKRIHDAGFKLELAISGAWGESGDLCKPGGGTCAIGGWGARENNFPAWVAAGNGNGTVAGDIFLTNYMNNVLRPTAQFLAGLPSDLFGNGDIFQLSFEMSYPSSDFTWMHNQKWHDIITEIRGIFGAAGKSGVLLTLDHCGWYDDAGLGYTTVKLLNSSAPLTSDNKGISGALYLKDLDFISFSNWLPLILQSQEKATWADSDVPFLTECWFANPNFYKVGTGYGGVPNGGGRDIIADMRALSQVMGKLIVQNTGWESSHGFLYHSPNRVSGAAQDLMEQRVAWEAQLAAIKDTRSQWQSWCAGMDFERYAEDKATTTTTTGRLGTSWRNAPAQAAIIAGIDSILAS
jgi:hypothetical protein